MVLECVGQYTGVVERSAMGKLLSTLKRGAYFPCPQHLTHVVADITRELVDADSSIGWSGLILGSRFTLAVSQILIRSTLLMMSGVQ